MSNSERSVQGNRGVYKVIADALKSTKPREADYYSHELYAARIDQWLTDVRALTTSFQMDNPLFKEELFMRAAGATENPHLKGA